MSDFDLVLTVQNLELDTTEQTLNLGLVMPLEVGGSGITGPGSSTDGDVMLWSGTAGVAAKESGVQLSALATVSSLSSESAARTTADGTLQTNINAEATTRAAADSALATSIAAIVVPRPYSAQSSSSASVAILAATTYMRFLGTGQTATFPALSAMTEGAELTVRDCAGTASGAPIVISASGSDTVSDVSAGGTSFTLDSNGASAVFVAVFTAGAWERKS